MSIVFRFRLTPAEADALYRRAVHEGCDLSTIIRRVLRPALEEPNFVVHK